MLNQLFKLLTSAVLMSKAYQQQRENLLSFATCFCYVISSSRHSAITEEARLTEVTVAALLLMMHHDNEKKIEASSNPLIFRIFGNRAISMAV